MVFNNATYFNNISVITWWSVLLVLPVTDKLYQIMLYRINLTMSGIQTHNLAMIGTVAQVVVHLTTITATNTYLRHVKYQSSCL